MTITISSLFLSACNLFVSNTLIRYIFTAANFKPQIHIKLIELLLFFPLYIRRLLVCRTFSKWKVHVLVFSRTLLRTLVSVHFHTCLLLVLVIVGLFWRRSMYSLVCICVHTASCYVCFRFVCVNYLFHSRELYCDRLYMCIFILGYYSCLLLLGYLGGVRCIR